MRASGSAAARAPRRAANSGQKGCAEPGLADPCSSIDAYRLSGRFAENEREHDRSEKNQEDGRENAADQRQEHLDGGLVGQFLRSLAALETKLGRLNSEHLPKAGTHSICEDERGDEGGERRQVHALDQSFQRLLARLAKLQLLEHEAEFVLERPGL